MITDLDLPGDRRSDHTWEASILDQNRPIWTKNALFQEIKISLGISDRIFLGDRSTI
tara:strand:- start:191 stop:361 length:171 start_codon:yes stop_codon:yes gene_type:complete